MQLVENRSRTKVAVEKDERLLSVEMPDRSVLIMSQSEAAELQARVARELEVMTRCRGVDPGGLTCCLTHGHSGPCTGIGDLFLT